MIAVKTGNKVESRKCLVCIKQETCAIVFRELGWVCPAKLNQSAGLVINLSDAGLGAASN